MEYEEKEKRDFVMIGIIGALADEIKAIAAMLENKHLTVSGGLEFTVGTLEGQEVALTVCGMGKVFAAMAAQTMINEFAPELIINIGAAGTLSDELHIGDIAIGEKTLQHDMDNSPIGFKKGEIAELASVYFPCDEAAVELLCECASELSLAHKRAVIATGDVFVNKCELKERISTDFGAEVAEMEGAAIGQVCTFRATPYVVVRAISDEADNSAPENFPAFLNKVIEDAAELVKLFCKKHNEEDKQ